ncbi:hypothetical protein VPH35_000339 [Triticum aestivum]
MQRADPMLAMASSTGIAPPSSSNALAVGLWDAQQLEEIGAGDTKPASINPLLLASACFGSWTTLNYLFSKEDKQAPLMVQPTQVFLDLLIGYSVGNSTKGRLTVPQASEDVENVVDQPALSTTTLLLKGITAEGDTALHAVASNGDSEKFLKCAIIIYKRDQDLLYVVNKKGDTPLHCAARAGKSQMLSCLVELAQSCNRLHELLRKENVLQETALHDAVRIGNGDIVEHLLKADPELANYPKEGTSPLYLAISLAQYDIAQTLHDKSNGNLSYSGPNGQNALHAATFRGSVITITKHLLNWNNSLTTHGDTDGSTPLHFASAFRCSNRFRQLLEANPALVYQADNKGLFPIHVDVAASVGAKNTINIILEKFPSSAGLCTAQGRTFLHVAVERRSLDIVSFVCQTPSLDWILNMRDSDGNTAMHLAVQSAMLRCFCSLFGNMETIIYGDNIILMALALAGARNSCSVRWDQIREKYIGQLKPEDEVKEAEKMKDSSQMLGVGSVLLTTMAFGATFAVPGGFIADDRTNRGTPILARRYTFDAFMIANALAFICSGIATIGLMLSGSPLINLRTRRINLGASVFFMSSSVTCLAATFALGVYMVLAPVAHATGIVVCVLCPLAVLYRSLEVLLKLAIVSVLLLLWDLWPFILIFGWAAIARNLRNH